MSALNQSNIFQQRKNFRANSIISESSSDVFISQNINHTSFKGIIPRKEIFKACDDLKSKASGLTESSQMAKLADDFEVSFLKIIEPPAELSLENKAMFRLFGHEVKNGVCNNTRLIYEPSLKQIIPKIHPDIQSVEGDLEYFQAQKLLINKIVAFCSESVNRWAVVEKWGDKSNLIVSFDDVYKELNGAIKDVPKSMIKIQGESLLKDKSVKDPAQFYNLFSQPLLNAIKYGEGKPVKVVIEEVVKDGQKSYYATFTNPHTKAVSDAELDKLLEGKKYRASNAKDAKIDGTGLGLSEVVRILKENGHEKDLSTLFKKGREEGFSIRIPLIGIQ